MLRLTALLLVLLNLVYYAWAHNWLLAYGWGQIVQREPQLLAQQIRPEALIITKAAALAPALSASTPGKTLATPDAESAPTPWPTLATGSCWQINALDKVQFKTLQTLLGSKLPQGSWSLGANNKASGWLLHLGPHQQNSELAQQPAAAAKEQAVLSGIQATLPNLSLLPCTATPTPTAPATAPAASTSTKAN